MRRVGLTAARLAASAWAGGAVLFVATAFREVTYPGFDSTTRDTLAMLRFPVYYAVGFGLMTIALLGAFVAVMSSHTSRPSHRMAVGLLALAYLLMIVDYVAVYRPMRNMIDPPGSVKPADFRRYHMASEYLNTSQVAICAIAAVLLCRDPTLTADAPHPTGTKTTTG